MINYLNGTLVEKTPTYVVIDCNGIGFELQITLNTYSHLPNENTPCKLITHLHVKEDARILFGFSSTEELNLFRLLISISGVGPSTAQIMLSAINASELASCIATENVKVLQSIKGIGAKTAQRIIIELKDKVTKMNIVSDKFSLRDNNFKIEALSALTSLGFAKQTAEKVLDKIIQENANLSVEELIKQSLKLL